MLNLLYVTIKKMEEAMLLCTNLNLYRKLIPLINFRTPLKVVSTKTQKYTCKQ